MALSLSSFISQLTKIETPRGPSPAYSPAHVIELLLILDSEQTMGRITLSKRLGVGEGSVRTMIKKLVESQMISVDAVGGCHLTDSGKLLVTDLRKVILATADVDLNEMGIALPSKAIQLRGLSLVNSHFTRLRDIGVRNGAEGMVIFIFKNGNFMFPLMTDEVSDVAKNYPNITNCLKSIFSLNEGDVVFIAFSKELRLAEEAALSAAISLIA